MISKLWQNTVRQTPIFRDWHWHRQWQFLQKRYKHLFNLHGRGAKRVVDTFTKLDQLSPEKGKIRIIKLYGL